MGWKALAARKFVELAYESILNHDFERAVDMFEQAIALEPDNASNHYKLSITCARSNKLAKAMMHASEALRLDPDNDTYRYHHKHLYARELVGQAKRHLELHNDPHLAIACLQRAVEADPLLVEAFLVLAAAYSEIDDYHLALQAAQEAAKLEPGNEAALSLSNKIKYQFKLQINES
jgi:tetratricopeptide (TPR) repeat protein